MKNANQIENSMPVLSSFDPDDQLLERVLFRPRPARKKPVWARYHFPLVRSANFVMQRTNGQYRQWFFVLFLYLFEYLVFMVKLLILNW